MERNAVVARFDRELAMLAALRRRLCESEGPGFHIPTGVVDGGLDARNRATDDHRDLTGPGDGDLG